MRSAGILFPVFSLPSRYGIGCFSKEAYRFVDWLAKAGQTCWQILPLGPTSYGDSPYQSFSVFAGNPYFIDPDALVEEGTLTREECEASLITEESGSIDYGKLYETRYQLLYKAYQRSDISRQSGFQEFCRENEYWLRDYAIFMAVKNYLGGISWDQWPEDIRKRWGYSMEYYQRTLYYEIEFQEYLQYQFSVQWKKLKAYAGSRGIRIIGDIPIYAAYDSADAWAHPELFQLDSENLPTAVAGCPPDGFSADGQLWGNPLYRWDYHLQTGFDWWMRRLAHCFRLYDILRIDHFRGFDEYFSIPYGEKTAKNGHWEKGPGIALFDRMQEVLGSREVIAEDLGYVTDSVRELVRNTGFPGMKVLEFAFDSRDTGSASDYLPHNYPVNSVVYTGTHDNETLMGWLTAILPGEKKMVQRYLNRPEATDEQLCRAMVCTALQSVARLCVIPLQDYLALGNEARINKPSTLGCNWKWRAPAGTFTDSLAEEIRELSSVYGRLS